MISRCKSVAIVDCCAIVVDWFLLVSRSVGRLVATARSL